MFLSTIITYSIRGHIIKGDSHVERVYNGNGCMTCLYKTTSLVSFKEIYVHVTRHCDKKYGQIKLERFMG